MEKVSIRDIYGDTLVELGKTNENIVVLDADLSGSTRTSKFAKAFPDRFFNIGIAEQNMVSIAAGLAVSGKTAFVSTFAVFLTGRCWDQIRCSVALSNTNVKLVATHGGISVGADGGTHQANEDVALMRCLPKMNVIVPTDGVETKKVIEYISQHYGPYYVRLSREKRIPVFNNDYIFEPGKGTILIDGTDAAIIAMGATVPIALEASALLKNENISVRVVNMSSVKPIDRDLIIDCAKKTKGIVTFEEHNVIGGLSSAVAEVLSTSFPVKMRMIGINDEFGESGDPAELFEKHGLTIHNCVQKVKEVIG